MNKQQFIKAFADKANFTQKDAGIAFEAMAATIAERFKSLDSELMNLREEQQEKESTLQQNKRLKFQQLMFLLSNLETVSKMLLMTNC